MSTGPSWQPLMRKIIYDDAALSDLVDLHSYITREGDLSSADKYIAGLIETTERIAREPHTGITEQTIALPQHH